MVFIIDWYYRFDQLLRIVGRLRIEIGFWAIWASIPRYRIFWIPRSSGFSVPVPWIDRDIAYFGYRGIRVFSGQFSVRDRGIAFLAYRGLLPFLGFCNVKCSVLGWGSEGLSGWFRGTV